MRRRMLRWAAGIGARHPGKVLAGAVILTIASLVPVFIGGRFETDLEKMLPPGDPQTEAFMGYVRDFGALEMMLVVFESKDEKDPEPIEALKPVLPTLSDDLMAMRDYVKEVEYMVGKQQEAFLKKSLAERAFFYVEPEEYSDIREKFSTDGIRQSMKRARAILQTDTTLFRKRIAPDPLNLYGVFEKRLQRMGNQFTSGKDRYYVSPDGTMLVMIVRATQPVQDLVFSYKLVRRVKQTVTDSLARAVRDSHLEPDALERISVKYGGAYPNAVYDTKALRADVLYTFAFSIFTVLLLFGVVFRRFGMVFYVGAPLVVSVVWTIGLAFALFGRLSVISGGAAAILVGLGIDFAIHIYNRYSEERERGAGLEEALVEAAAHTGEGILFGALTTAMAFYGVTVTRFTALSELGFLAGTGVLLEMLAMLIVLPAMLVMRERLSGGKPVGLAAFSFGLEGTLRFVKRFAPYITVAVFGTGAIAAWLVVSRISLDQFDSEFRNLKPKRHPIQDLHDHIMYKMNTNVDNMLLISQGKDEQEALERADALRHKLNSLMQKKEILKYQSFADYVPPKKRQQQAVEFLRGLGIDRVLRDLREAAEAEGIRPKAFAEFTARLEKLKEILQSPEWVTIDELKEVGLHTFLQRYYAVKKEKGQALHRVVTYVQPKRGPRLQTEPGEPPRWQGLPSEWYDEQFKVLGADYDTLIMTSGRQVAFEMRDLVQADFSWITVMVLGGVILCLLITFSEWSLRVLFLRLPLRVIAALLPLLTGVFWMVALMLLLDMKFNYVNVIVVPAIIGIGIDNGIHILHRYLEERDISLIMGKTGRALMMTSLTTMLGFGSLAVSRFPGLRSLGIVAFMGVGMCLIASLIGFNALLHWLGRYVAGPRAVKSNEGEKE